ncbi:hypothetical protein BDZ89DRAFT_1191263 [Hymenopellis radicata]|nr:hypothetical protein BDZ89DRAFT_1191263 [Hymenopellis radicata]
MHRHQQARLGHQIGADITNFVVMLNSEDGAFSLGGVLNMITITSSNAFDIPRLVVLDSIHLFVNHRHRRASHSTLFSRCRAVIATPRCAGARLAVPNVSVENINLSFIRLLARQRPRIPLALNLDHDFRFAFQEHFNVSRAVLIPSPNSWTPDARSARPPLAGIPSSTHLQPCCTTLTSHFLDPEAWLARPPLGARSPRRASSQSRPKARSFQAPEQAVLQAPVSCADARLLLTMLSSMLKHQGGSSIVTDDRQSGVRSYGTSKYVTNGTFSDSYAPTPLTSPSGHSAGDNTVEISFLEDNMASRGVETSFSMDWSSLHIGGTSISVGSSSRNVLDIVRLEACLRQNSGSFCRRLLHSRDRQLLSAPPNLASPEPLHYIWEKYSTTISNNPIDFPHLPSFLPCHLAYYQHVLPRCASRKRPSDASFEANRNWAIESFLGLKDSNLAKSAQVAFLLMRSGWNALRFKSPNSRASIFTSSSGNSAGGQNRSNVVAPLGDSRDARAWNPQITEQARKVLRVPAVYQITPPTPRLTLSLSDADETTRRRRRPRNDIRGWLLEVVRPLEEFILLPDNTSTLIIPGLRRPAPFHNAGLINGSVGALPYFFSYSLLIWLRALKAWGYVPVILLANTSYRRLGSYTGLRAGEYSLAARRLLSGRQELRTLLDVLTRMGLTTTLNQTKNVWPEPEFVAMVCDVFELDFDDLGRGDLAHFFSYNVSSSVMVKEEQRSNFLKEIPKFVKRFGFLLGVWVLLIAAIVVLSMGLVPWQIEGSRSSIVTDDRQSGVVSYFSVRSGWNALRGLSYSVTYSTSISEVENCKIKDLDARRRSNEDKITLTLWHSRENVMGLGFFDTKQQSTNEDSRDRGEGPNTMGLGFLDAR